MISKNIRFNNEYYVWPIFNENINGWYSIGYHISKSSLKSKRLWRVFKKQEVFFMFSHLSCNYTKNPEIKSEN